MIKRQQANSLHMRSYAGWTLYDFRGAMHIAGYGNLGECCPLELCSAQPVQLHMAVLNADTKTKVKRLP